jgi:hypothetical protein
VDCTRNKLNFLHVYKICVDFYYYGCKLLLSLTAAMAGLPLLAQVRSKSGNKGMFLGKAKIDSLQSSVPVQSNWLLVQIVQIQVSIQPYLAGAEHNLLFGQVCYF